MRAPGVLWRETYDQVLLLVPGSDEVVAGNLCAAAVWDVLASAEEEGEITRAVQETFELELDDARRDVTSALEQLRLCGAVTRVEH